MLQILSKRKNQERWRERIEEALSGVGPVVFVHHEELVRGGR